jgi:hypothetical protein
MLRSKSVEWPTGTDSTNELSTDIFIFLVSVGDGVGSGDGVGVGTVAVPGLLPHATKRKPMAIAARNDLSILKF